jgi:transcriptional regulator with XRE-family HTH domain
MSEAFRKGLASRIKDAREGAGLVQKEIANAVGVSTGTVGGWEIGEGGPNVEDLPILSRLTGRSANYFAGLPEPSKLPPDVVALINLYCELPREETKKDVLAYVGQQAARYRRLTEKDREASSEDQT